MSIVSAEEDRVYELGPHDNMTAQQALEVVKREDPPEAIIVYEDDDGNIVIRASKMSDRDQIYLLERAKITILGLLLDEV